MRVKKISDKIYLCIFNNQKDMCSTFLRFQERYESPKFRNKIFSLNEFKKWYTNESTRKNSDGIFTYSEDWNGFNIPSHILKPFQNEKYNPLSTKEKQFIKKFENCKGRFYIIGVHGKDESNYEHVLKHEMAHALFYTDSGYRKQVKTILSMPSFISEDFTTEHMDKINNWLLEKGYHKSVWIDETNAYILDGRFDVPKELSDFLNKMYDKALKNNS